ncbi:MAG: NAD-binding protein [Fervidicoccaceae archaeon]
MRYVVVGATHFAELALRTIREHDLSPLISVVERSTEVAETLARAHGASAFHGDLEDLATLEKAGARRADFFLAATESDSLNLRLGELAKNVLKVPRVLVFLRNPMNAELAREKGLEPVAPDELALADLIVKLSSSEWVEIPLPGELGVSVLFYRVSGRGSPPLGEVRAAVEELGGLLIVRSPAGELARSEPRLGRGWTLTAVVPRERREELLKRLARICSRRAERGEEAPEAEAWSSG